MYKDKDRQKEANRIAAKKYRDSMTGKGMTIAPSITPKSDIPVIPKRGLDIKCFEDLPLDVQQSIHREPEDQWPRRTAAAIHYQQLFPYRYHPNSDTEALPRTGYVPPGRRPA